MKFSSVKLAYFSPTGTTKKILEGIAEGIGIEHVEHVSMTLPDATTKPFENLREELVVIGSPVYAGRLPDDTVNRFKRFQAYNTLAVLVVVYGNREFEDALLELYHVSKELGFIPISGAAFIGEHSFSTDDVPIATGRPDKEDIDKAIVFGKAIKQKISDIQSFDAITPFKVPGNYPYKDGMIPIPGSPMTLDDICNTCGSCAVVCPKAAITVNTVVTTDQSLCIKCCACVKECPTNARIMDVPFIKKIAETLSVNCSQRKEPEVFL
jgi:ferredoxin